MSNMLDQMIGRTAIYVDGARIGAVRNLDLVGPSAVLDAAADKITLTIRGQDTAPISARDYGAKGDGSTDDSAALTAALSASATTGGRVHLPRGVYRVASPVRMLSYSRLTGEGPDKTIIEVPNGFDFAALDLDDATGVLVSGLQIRMAPGSRGAGVNSRGIWIRGASSDVFVQDVVVRGSLRPFEIAGGMGAVAGTCQRITLRDCRAYDAGQYGVVVDDTQGLLLDNCYVERADLDCYKLRKLTGKVTLRSCWGLYGGRNTSHAGDGIDCYAGGADVMLDGCVFAYNGDGSVGGNGITVKSDLLNKTDPATYGHVRNIVIRGCNCSHNNGTGIGTYRHSGLSTPDDPTIPLLSGVVISDCVCDSNTYYGLFLGARAVGVTNVIARGNGRQGILLQDNCLDVSIVNPLVLGNGSGSSIPYDHGIKVDGRRVSIIGGTVAGVDDDTIAIDSDHGPATPNASAATYVGIYVGKTADEVQILGTHVHSCRGADIAVSGGRTWVQTQTYTSISGAEQPRLGLWAHETAWTDNDDGTFSHVPMADGSQDLTQSSVLTINQVYTVEFEILSIGTGSITPVCGTASGTARNTAGKFIEDITCTGNTDFAITASVDTDAVVRVVSVVNAATTKPAAITGTMRLPSGTTGLSWRNAANTQDIDGIKVTTGDVVGVGDTNAVTMAFAAANEIALQPGGVSRQRITPAGLGLNGKSPVAVPTVNWSSSDSATVKALMTALVATGLVNGSEI